MEQRPGATRVTVCPLVPDVVHTGNVVEANVTGSVELAVADMVNGRVPKSAADNALKVMVCVSAPA